MAKTLEGWPGYEFHRLNCKWNHTDGCAYYYSHPNHDRVRDEWAKREQEWLNDPRHKRGRHEKARDLRTTGPVYRGAGIRSMGERAQSELP